MPLLKRRDNDATEDESPNKRRRRGGVADPSGLGRRGVTGGGVGAAQTGAASRHSGRSPRRAGSDTEDGADYLAAAAAHLAVAAAGCGVNLANFQPRSTRYNFCTELGTIFSPNFF